MNSAGFILSSDFCLLYFFFVVDIFQSDDIPPVQLEYYKETFDRLLVGGDQADLAALFQFDSAQALAAEEDLLPVANDRLCMQMKIGNFFDLDAYDAPIHLAYDFDLDPRF
jgi:hypothetical protein